MPENETTGQQSSQPDLYAEINKLPAGEKVIPTEAPETPPVETPPVETPPAEPQETPPVETPTESSAETPPAETPPVETPPTEQPVETEKVFEINDINQRFGTSFTDESEFKLTLDRLERIEELEEQVKELEKVKEENLLIKENIDPMKYFSSEDEFKAVLFKKQFPDKDAATAFKLMSSDISQMEPKDLIAYEMMLNTPGITKAEADAVVNHTYNIEEGEEINPNDVVRMKVDGATAGRNIEALKSQITLPEKTDVDSLVSQRKEQLEKKKEMLKQGWGAIGNEVERTLTDLTVNGKNADDTDWSFTYSMSKDFPSEVTQSMVDVMANTGTELTKEAVQTLGEAMQKEYYYRNIDKIITAVREDTIAKFEEKKMIEQHNPETPKPDAEPSKSDGTDMNSQVLAALQGNTATIKR